MISALQCAKLCQALYAPVPAAGAFQKVWSYDDVVVGLQTQDNGGSTLVLRGSKTAEDWIRDGCFLPAWHSQLGFCHSGFLLGMDDVFSEVRSVATGKVTITGHSLGGARARLLAGLFAVNGLVVDSVQVFGSPKPAFINLARILQKSGMAHTSYRFYNDVVPLLALDIPPLFPILPYVHPENWIPLEGHSAADDLGPLRDHAIANYVAALP